MKEYVYTYLDDFEILHYGHVNAQSEKEAKRKIEEQHGSDASIEIWHQCKPYFQGKNFWYNLCHVNPPVYYLWKKKENELVYVGPKMYCWFRLFFLFMIIGAVIFNGMITAIPFGFLFALTFVQSNKLIIQHKSILYKRRFFFRTKIKSIDISKATNLLRKEKEFKTESGKKQHYHFICLEKDGEEVVIYGGRIAEFYARKITEDIGGFLGLPVEILSPPEAL